MLALKRLNCRKQNRILGLAQIEKNIETDDKQLIKKKYFSF